MGKGVTITGDKQLLKEFERINKAANKEMNAELKAFGLLVEGEAKALAPGDEGFLRNRIKSVPGNLEVEVIVNADYAAYMEFGTKRKAASYVSGLPSDWQQVAASFKGKGKGDYFDFLNNILDWVKRKKIAQITNSYTGRKSTKKNDLLYAANMIAMAILRNGVTPHPFLYPAYQNNVKQFQERLDKIISGK